MPTNTDNNNNNNSGGPSDTKPESSSLTESEYEVLLKYIAENRIDKISDYIENDIKDKTNLRFKDKSGYTVLHKAILKSDNNKKTIAEILLKKDKQLLEEADSLGNTPLHIAAYCGYSDIIKLLLKYGANAMARNTKGDTPLHLLMRTKHLIITANIYNNKVENYDEIIKLLLTKGAEINAQNNEGHTPLYAAVVNKSKEAINSLLKLGADVNIADEDNFTPLHIAAGNAGEDVSTIKLLILYGANINAENNTGKKPLCYASGEAHAILKELQSAASVRSSQDYPKPNDPISAKSEIGDEGTAAVRPKDQNPTKSPINKEPQLKKQPSLIGDNGDNNNTPTSSSNNNNNNTPINDKELSVEEAKKLLIMKGYSFSGKDLENACEEGDLEAVKLLVAHLEPEEINTENTNCLKIALGNIKKGEAYYELFAFLAQHPKVNAGVSDSYLLRDECLFKDLEAFILLAKNPNSNLAIFKALLARKAAEEGKNDYLCAILKNYRSLGDGHIRPSDYNNTAVRAALQQSNIEAVRMLIFAGVFINYPPTDRWLVRDYVNNLIKTGKLSYEEFIDSKDKLVNLLNNPEQLGKLTKDELDILHNTAHNLGINLDEKSCIAAITAIRSQSKTDNNNNNQGSSWWCQIV